MEAFREYIRGKKVTVMGLGVLGRGVGDAALLAECGTDVLVTDLKSESELKDSLEKLKAFSNITYRLGEHRKEDFEDRDFILVAAGVPMHSEYLEYARMAGVPLRQSAALFAVFSGIPIIGVTGTRGKSTVTHMIYHVLMHATEGANVILGGNVRGVSNLQLLKEVEEGSIGVMELDSWQLQGFGWMEISPQIAVLTNFMEDHMNYYGGDMDAYFADKANIFLYQEDSGVFVTTPKVFKRAQEFARGKHITLGQEVVLADNSILPEDTLLAIPGEHNRLNAALAYEVLRATSLPEDLILEGLATFPGVPGRLQYVKEVEGVKIFNDNNATTPSATIAGLKALGEEKNIVLIMGGSDKGVDMRELASAVPEYCKKVILLPGTGTESFKKAAENLSVNRKLFTEAVSLEEAVKKGMESAKAGDTILFSPACASFGLFKNEYDRNDQFVELVNSLGT